MSPREARPLVPVQREVCPYDGTVLYDGEGCPVCEASVQDHLLVCWRCAGDWADVRAMDARLEAASELLR